jgi:hypothetical protein
MSMLRVLSLGAGVQSTTLALMAAHGEIEPPDCAIFADTQSEPLGVYSHLARLKGLVPFEIEMITAGSLTTALLSGTNSERNVFGSIPYFLIGEMADGGMAKRQCTREYKITPLNKRMRELLGYRPRQRIPPGSCEVWLGISTDEAHRMKPAREAWQVNRYPLIEARMSRGDCLAWLERHGYERPQKSACTFCPYRSNEQWRLMKRVDPASFEEACRVDEAIRTNRNGLRLKAIPYLHRSLRPLADVDFDQRMDDLFGNECEGMCGV